MCLRQGDSLSYSIAQGCLSLPICAGQQWNYGPTPCTAHGRGQWELCGYLASVLAQAQTHMLLVTLLVSEGKFPWLSMAMPSIPLLGSIRKLINSIKSDYECGILKFKMPQCMTRGKYLPFWHLGSSKEIGFKNHTSSWACGTVYACNPSSSGG